MWARMHHNVACTHSIRLCVTSRVAMDQRTGNDDMVKSSPHRRCVAAGAWACGKPRARYCDGYLLSCVGVYTVHAALALDHDLLSASETPHSAPTLVLLLNDDVLWGRAIYLIV